MPGRRWGAFPRRIAGRLALAALLLAPALAAAQASAAERGEDFDAMWRAIDGGYAYFEHGDAAWQRARATWRPRAANARTGRAFVEALEGALATLDDDHVSLAHRTPDSPRHVPGETDVWARWKDARAVVEAVRTFGDADVAGLRPGDIVTRIQGVDAAEAVRRRVGEGASAERRDRALRALLAGPRFGTLRLEVRDAKAVREIAIARANVPAATGPSLLARRMGESRDIGYLRLRNAGDDERLVRRLDAAITMLRGTRGLIFDLRESAGPRSRSDTAAILARFAPAGTPWQLRQTRKARRITDIVPAGHRSPPYPEPVVVLTDRWTEGEAEALAAGLHEAAHARIAGTPSAGLRGDLQSVTLPHSRIVVRFPAERTFLLDGTPRENLRPEIPVDLAAPSGGPGDPILYQALKAFEPGKEGAR
ncbi:MAG TPA: S41 family peptidase [Usitatibacter sp.]|nr:S41 family peptidase [Usitatibacter sp.]